MFVVEKKYLLSEAKRITKNLIAAKCTMFSEEQGKYVLTGENYLLERELKEILNIETEAGNLTIPHQYIEGLVKDFVNESGLLMVAVDEYHCPPLRDIGFEEDVLEMIRYCIRLLILFEKEEADPELIEAFINNNIEEFCFIDNNIFEPPRIKKEVAEQIAIYLDGQGFFRKV